MLEAECKSRGIELTYKDKYYIQGIGGLKEKECGGGSGWMYRVNGVAPHKAAVGYYLKDGDVVEWYYVTNIMIIKRKAENCRKIAKKSGTYA